MKKIIVFTVVMMMTLSMLLSGCGAQNPDSSGQTGKSEYIIRLGHSDTEDNLINVSLQHYADWVSEQTGGRVIVRLYPNEELGDNTEMAQQLITGELDAMMMPQGVEAKYAPKIAVLGLPFLFTSYEQVWAVIDNEEIAEGLTEGLEGYNLKQLAFWENGMRQITNNAREINTPDDIKGLKMRVPDDDMTFSIFKKMGAVPTSFSWSRTYEALRQGTFDGQENPVANIYANKINEVNQYMTITNHQYQTKNLVVSLSKWNSLPSDVQEVLLEGAKVFGKEHREAVASQEAGQLEELKKSGMQVNESPDIDAFKKATRDVYRDFELRENSAADLVADIRKAASQAD